MHIHHYDIHFCLFTQSFYLHIILSSFTTFFFRHTITKYCTDCIYGISDVQSCTSTCEPCHHKLYINIKTAVLVNFCLHLYDMVYKTSDFWTFWITSNHIWLMSPTREETSTICWETCTITVWACSKRELKTLLNKLC